LYATFDNGMVYKYIKGETLNTSTVREPSIYRLVATTMARFHRLGTNGISARDGTIKSELWNKMEQFANLIPKRFSSPSNDLRLVHSAAHNIILINNYYIRSNTTHYNLIILT
jgi:ethanolamine kinase